MCDIQDSEQNSSQWQVSVWIETTWSPKWPSLWPFDYGTNYYVAFPRRRPQNTDTISDRYLRWLWQSLRFSGQKAIPVVLRHFGLPDPVVADVMQFYHGSIATVLIRFGLTETFDATSGVLQGDTLSPHIFILLVDYILRQLHVDNDGFTLKPANGRRHPAVTLTALAYTDDVTITSDYKWFRQRCWKNFAPFSILFRGGRLDIDSGENKRSSCCIWEWCWFNIDIRWYDDGRIWYLQLPFSTDTPPK